MADFSEYPHPNLQAPNPAPIVCDYETEFEGKSLKELKSAVFPRADIFLIGINSLAALLGKAARNHDEVSSAAIDLVGEGAKAVLVKGAGSGAAVQDFFCKNNGNKFWISSKRLNVENAKGKGAALSSFIVKAISIGLNLEDAIIVARFMLQAGIGNSGNGISEVRFPAKPEDFPWINKNPEEGRRLFKFSEIDFNAPELYPIVDSCEWVSRLSDYGAKTIQLRIKGLAGGELEREIKSSIELARERGIRLFINDYWELSIKYGGYGVHLGQEDILTADIRTIEKAGLRLGVSTHCYYEAAIARGLRPSYIALGPIYHTALKAMDFAPQGAGALKLWSSIFDCPVVAIGGITLELSDEVMKGSPDFISVVRDLTLNENPEARVKAWIEKLSR